MILKNWNPALSFPKSGARAAFRFEFSCSKCKRPIFIDGPLHTFDNLNEFIESQISFLKQIRWSYRCLRCGRENSISGEIILSVDKSARERITEKWQRKALSNKRHNGFFR